MGGLVKLELETRAGMGVLIEQKREGSHPEAGGGLGCKWCEKAPASMSRSGCGGGMWEDGRMRGEGPGGVYLAVGSS